jgi:hypothetical protein
MDAEVTLPNAEKLVEMSASVTSSPKFLMYRVVAWAPVTTQAPHVRRGGEERAKQNLKACESAGGGTEGRGIWKEAGAQAKGHV